MINVNDWFETETMTEYFRQLNCRKETFDKKEYSVNIHERDFLKLWSYGAIEEVIDGIYVVNDRAQYDENVGLRLDNHWMNEILTI